VAEGFEDIFGLSGGHVLRLAGYRRSGERLRRERWEHEEYDAEGRLVAVYESWSVSDAASGQRVDGGFVQYAANGDLVCRRGWLDRAWATPEEGRASSRSRFPSRATE